MCVCVCVWWPRGVVGDKTRTVTSILAPSKHNGVVSFPYHAVTKEMRFG